MNRIVTLKLRIHFDIIPHFTRQNEKSSHLAPAEVGYNI